MLIIKLEGIDCGEKKGFKAYIWLCGIEGRRTWEEVRETNEGEDSK